MMNEALLHFIWKYSLYNPAGLYTTVGESVTIVHPGSHNQHAGPDFSGARIRIGDTLLIGNVELHLKTSDWKAHKHDEDEAYGNIILHVVYEDDKLDEAKHPKLILKDAIPAHIVERYTDFTNAVQPIPCASQLNKVNAITKESWLSRLLAERWEQKLEDWKVQLANANGDWRTLLYWRLAHNFGFKVNSDAFLMLAQSLPLIILGKHKHSLMQIEALLYGQAGMLGQPFTEAYPIELQKEYFYLKKKYKLESIQPHLWKFLRMRPANFPTVRIAQFAALIHQSVHLFSEIVETWNAKEIKESFNVTASAYWANHAVFNEAQEKSQPKRLGISSVENVIINTVAPLQFLYAHMQGSGNQQDKALELLTSIRPEDNHVIDSYKQAGWKAANALQTQGLIQLYNNYCTPKKCLNCAVGLSIIKSAPVK